MAPEFRIADRWPDLFEGLSQTDVNAVLQVLGSAFLDGWVPNRDDVADLVALHTHCIDGAEYERRSAALVYRPPGGDR